MTHIVVHQHLCSKIYRVLYTSPVSTFAKCPICTLGTGGFQETRRCWRRGYCGYETLWWQSAFQEQRSSRRALRKVTLRKKRRKRKGGRGGGCGGCDREIGKTGGDRRWWSQWPMVHKCGFATSANQYFCFPINYFFSFTGK